MRNMIRRFVRDEAGEDLIEYGLLAAFVAALAVVLLSANSELRNGILSAFGKAINALNTI